jgi:hypothetical protein
MEYDEVLLEELACEGTSPFVEAGEGPIDQGYFSNNFDLRLPQVLDFGLTC